MLADFLLCVWEVMKKIHTKTSFVIDYQYAIIPGKAIADGVLCALMVSDHVPLLVIEYKPKVASTIDDIDVSDLRKPWYRPCTYARGSSIQSCTV